MSSVSWYHFGIEKTLTHVSIELFQKSQTFWNSRYIITIFIIFQVNVIQAALNAAQATSENANEAASQAAGELGAQTAMVGAARQRLHALQEQLHGVRLDFEATQAAARKAQVLSDLLCGKICHDKSQRKSKFT